jgi:RHS repeat-associated protein
MDNDISGGFTGANYDYGFRIYDSRIAKFLSVDPLTKDYPWYTPYQFAGNKPIYAIDLDGLEEKVVTYYNVQHDGTTTKIGVVRFDNFKGDWEDTRYFNNYFVIDEDGNQTFYGDYGINEFAGQAQYEMANNDVDYEQGYEKMSFKEARIMVKEQPENQEAFNVMKNYFAMVTLPMGLGAIGKGKLLVQSFNYIGIASDADELLGGNNGALSDKIENQNVKYSISSIKLISGGVGTAKNTQRILFEGVDEIPSLVEGVKGNFDLLDNSVKTVNQVKDNKDDL